MRIWPVLLLLPLAGCLHDSDPIPAEMSLTEALAWYRADRPGDAVASIVATGDPEQDAFDSFYVAAWTGESLVQVRIMGQGYEEDQGFGQKVVHERGQTRFDVYHDATRPAALPDQVIDPRGLDWSPTDGQVTWGLFAYPEPHWLRAPHGAPAEARSATTGLPLDVPAQTTMAEARDLLGLASIDIAYAHEDGLPVAKFGSGFVGTVQGAPGYPDLQRGDGHAARWWFIAGQTVHTWGPDGAGSYPLTGDRSFETIDAPVIDSDEAVAWQDLEGRLTMTLTGGQAPSWSLSHLVGDVADIRNVLAHTYTHLRISGVITEEPPQTRSGVCTPALPVVRVEERRVDVIHGHTTWPHDAMVHTTVVVDDGDGCNAPDSWQQADGELSWRGTGLGVTVQGRNATLDGEPFLAGDRHEVAYEVQRQGHEGPYWWRGTIVVEHLGDWSWAGVRSVDAID